MAHTPTAVTSKTDVRIGSFGKQQYGWTHGCAFAGFGDRAMTAC